MISRVTGSEMEIGVQEICWEMFSVATVEGSVKSRTGRLGKPNSKATGAEASGCLMGAWEPK